MTMTLAIFGLGMTAFAALLALGLWPAHPGAASDPTESPPQTEDGLPRLRRDAGSLRLSSNPQPWLARALAEARLTWGPGRLALNIALAAVLAGAVLWLPTRQPIAAAIGAVAGGPVLVWLHLRRQREAYLRAFAVQFLPALDIIVRGLRSGMPLIAALQVVQKEIPGPVRIEFRRLLDDLSLGLPLTQAADRLAERVPLTKVQFFAIVIALQSRTGGRLSETLENLANTLRDRNQLAMRIRTVSQEARTSAVIIAALPVFVALGLFLLNPGYISVLFTHPIGLAVLCGCVIWMAVGGLIMKRMTEIHV